MYSRLLCKVFVKLNAVKLEKKFLKIVFIFLQFYAFSKFLIHK